MIAMESDDSPLARLALHPNLRIDRSGRWQVLYHPRAAFAFRGTGLAPVEELEATLKITLFASAKLRHDECSGVVIDNHLVGSAFLRQIVGVIPAVGVHVNQCEAVIGEDMSVAVNAVREIPKRHAVHRALFGIEAVFVSRCEEEQRVTLKDARDICNCPNCVLGIQMKHDAPRNRSIEHSLSERTGLNNSSNSKRLAAVPPKVCKHRTRTI